VDSLFYKGEGILKGEEVREDKKTKYMRRRSTKENWGIERGGSSKRVIDLELLL